MKTFAIILSAFSLIGVSTAATAQHGGGGRGGGRFHGGGGMHGGWGGGHGDWHGGGGWHDGGWHGGHDHWLLLGFLCRLYPYDGGYYGSYYPSYYCNPYGYPLFLSDLLSVRICLRPNYAPYAAALIPATRISRTAILSLTANGHPCTNPAAGWSAAASPERQRAQRSAAPATTQALAPRSAVRSAPSLAEQRQARLLTDFAKPTGRRTLFSRISLQAPLYERAKRRTRAKETDFVQGPEAHPLWRARSLAADRRRQGRQRDQPRELGRLGGGRRHRHRLARSTPTAMTPKAASSRRSMRRSPAATATKS